ncbi:magnesium-dependent phosphatase 1 [Marchantia polymorpha subsp. ruderalis]|nr:hypothetical protein MARPO_0032s0046 [Marchantia polymorpha]BBN11630.1 hypothetical protein Mp_5g13530 [Marchantia polymorpha subsp. ruderalis]|eukprot:PTQ41844.1 hypothetical protein MARPO_0032s0046 [Marchantia polymorpha]
MAIPSEVGYWSTYYDTNDEPEATRILNAASRLPALVVFDLDYTLWPYFCDCRSENESPVLYSQAKGVIQALKSKGVLMAIASRSPTANKARTFLSKLDLLSSFSVMEVYPSWSDKTDHFQKIHQKTGIPYNSMLFFDDEDRNIQAVGHMGVKSVQVHNGVNLAALKAGLQKFAGTENMEPQGRRVRPESMAGCLEMAEKTNVDTD